MTFSAKHLELVILSLVVSCESFQVGDERWGTSEESDSILGYAKEALPISFQFL